MDKERLLLALVLAGTAGLSACNPHEYASPLATKPNVFVPTEKPDTSVKTDSLYPTKIPTAAATEALIPTLEHVKTLEEKFNLGPLKLGTIPMDIHPSVELMKAMNFQNTDQTFHAKKIFPVTVDYFPTDDDNAVGTDFYKAASLGGVMVFQTDRLNMKVYDAHSEGFEAPGEWIRYIVSYLSKNPKNENDVYGKIVTLTPQGGTPINGEVVFVKSMTADEFDNAYNPGKIWGVDYAEDKVIFLRTDLAGIPDSIRNDNTPGVYYLIGVACVPYQGDQINLNIFDPNRDAFNQFNRGIVVLKIDMNKQAHP